MTPFKSRAEIAEEYGIDRKTLYLLLRKHFPGFPARARLNLKQQKEVYATLGWPGGIDKVEYGIKPKSIRNMSRSETTPAAPPPNQ